MQARFVQGEPPPRRQAETKVVGTRECSISTPQAWRTCGGEDSPLSRPQDVSGPLPREPETSTVLSQGNALLKWCEAWGPAPGLWGLWPVGRSQHLWAPLMASPQSGFQSRKTSATTRRIPQPQIRKTQTNTRPGKWSPWGQGDVAPLQHAEPESKEAAGQRGWETVPPRKACC